MRGERDEKRLDLLSVIGKQVFVLIRDRGGFRL